MSVLDTLVPGKRGGKFHNIGTEMARTVVYGSVFYGLGFAQNKWKDKAKVGRVPADMALGLGGTGLGLLATLFGVGRGVQPWLWEGGRIGLAAFGHALGAGHGGQSAGQARVLMPKKDVAKALAAVPGAVVVGAIPPAPTGDWLSVQDLRSLSKS